MTSNGQSIEEDGIAEKDNVSDFIKLKIKIYHLTCPRHPCFIRKRSFMGLHKIELSELFDNQAILYELRTSNFLGCATIIIWMNYQCLCRLYETESDNIVMQILNAIAENIQNLRYMTKLFHFNYIIHTNVLKYQDKKRFKCYRYYFDNVRKDNNYKEIDLIKPITMQLTNLAIEPIAKAEDNLALNDRDNLQMAIKDYGTYANNCSIDHLIFLQYLTYDSYMESHLNEAGFPSFHKLLKLFENLKPKEHVSVNEILSNEMLLIKRSQSTFNDDLVMAHTFANVDLYFHSINSAIAIIINNRFLNSRRQTARHGSDVDVEKLCHTFKIAKTLHCKLNDLSKDKLKQFMYWLRYANFKPFKNVYLFVMSHGDENGVLYTEDGNRVYLQEILNDLKHNQTADDANIFIYSVACRGKYDARYDDGPAPDETNHSIDLADNMAIFLSSREGQVSLRHRVKGTPFIATVTENLMAAQHNDNVVQVIGEKLKPKSMEHLVKDQNKCYAINKHTMALTQDVKDNFANNSKNLSQILDCSLELNDDLQVSATTPAKNFKPKPKADNKIEAATTTAVRRFDSILFLHIFGPIQNLHCLAMFELHLKTLPQYADDFKEYFIITTQYLLHGYKLFIEDSLSKMFSDHFVQMCQWQMCQENPCSSGYALKDSEIIKIFWQLTQQEFNIKDYQLFESVCQNWLAKCEQRIFKENINRTLLNNLDDCIKGELQGFIDFINLSPKAKDILVEEFSLHISNSSDLNHLTVGLVHLIIMCHGQDQKLDNNLCYNTFVNTFCIKTYQKYILLKKETFYYDRDRVGDIQFGEIKAEIFNTSKGIYLIRQLKENNFLDNREDNKYLEIPQSQLDLEELLEFSDYTCLEFLQFYAPLQTIENLIVFESLLRTTCHKENRKHFEIFLKANASFNNDYGENYKTFIEDSLSLILSDSLALQIQRASADKLEIIKELWLYIQDEFADSEKMFYEKICIKWLAQSKFRILKSAILKKLLYLPIDNGPDMEEVLHIIENSSEANDLLKEHYACQIPMAFQKDYNPLIAIWYLIAHKFSFSKNMPSIVADIVKANVFDNDPYFRELTDLYKFQFSNAKQFLMFNNHITTLDMESMFDIYFKLGLTITKDLNWFVQQIWLRLLHRNALNKLTWEIVKDLKITEIIEHFFYSHSQISKETNIFATICQNIFDIFRTNKSHFLIRELPLKSLDAIREYEDILRFSSQAQKQLEMYFTIMWCENESMEANIFTILHSVLDMTTLKEKCIVLQQHHVAHTFVNFFFMQLFQKFVKTKDDNTTGTDLHHVFEKCFNHKSKLKMTESPTNHFMRNTPFSCLKTLLDVDNIFSEDSRNFKELQIYFQHFSLNYYDFENEFAINNIWCEIIDEQLLLKLNNDILKNLNITKAVSKAFQTKFSANEAKFENICRYWFDEERLKLSSLIEQLPVTTKEQLLQINFHLEASNYASEYCYNFFNYLPSYYKSHSLIYAKIFNIPKFWSAIITDKLKAICLWNCENTEDVNEHIIINELSLTEICKDVYSHRQQFENISQIWFNNLVNEIIDKFCLVYEVEYKSLRLLK